MKEKLTQILGYFNNHVLLKVLFNGQENNQLWPFCTLKVYQKLILHYFIKAKL